ncbi:hypothetical protein JW926_01775, partial [Candidatus Sumerlaeota bacterium]|nr:hypothetical protein [Candidatus Sumerlaeota bacterium]
MGIVKQKTTNNQNKPKVLTPPVKKGQCPPFWEMDAYQFQIMCCSLLEMEEDVSTCTIYGPSGQVQFGIDLLAYSKKDGECYVVQCKCHTKFPPNKILKATDDFLKYWDEKWFKENVKRFYLMVACDITTTQQQDTIKEQKKIFEEKGIKYETWSATTICNKLRLHPGIVTQYLDSGWVGIICPPSISSQIQSVKPPSLLDDVLGNQLQQAWSVIDQDINVQLDEMRETFRIGNILDVIDWIKKIRDNRWLMLKPDIQAKILRFEANLQLEKGNFEDARTLSEKARSLTPDYDDSVLRALLNLHEDGPDSAIQILTEDNSNPEVINLKALLFLEIGKIDQCSNLLEKHKENLKDNPETMRIKSLMFRMSRDLESARESIESAYKMKPEWIAIRFVRALIDFESALAPRILKDEIIPSFEIIDWSLIKRDDRSMNYIRRASNTFDELINIPGYNVNQRTFLEGWKLTCLSCDFERQDEAERYCKELLTSQPEHPIALLWALGRKYAIETLDSSITYFDSLYKTKKIKTQQIIDWIICLAAKGDLKEALSVLNKTKHRFSNNEDKRIWNLWKTQCLSHNGQVEKASQIFKKISDKKTQKPLKALILKSSLNKKQNHEQVFKYLISLYHETGKGKYLFDACSIMANQNKWGRIFEYIEDLMSSVGTSDAVRLCIHTLYNTQKYQECLNLIDKYKVAFRNNTPTHDIRQIQVTCQISLGKINIAFEEARKLYEQDPNIWNLRAFIETLSYKGDYHTLEKLAQKALSGNNIPPEESMFLLEQIKYNNPELAKEILRQVKTKPYPVDMVPNILQEAIGLGIENEAKDLFSRLPELSKLPESRIKAFKIEEIESKAKEYNEQLEENGNIHDAFIKAEIPIHFYSENIDPNLAILYHTNLVSNQNNENTTPVFLLGRHGGLPVAKDLPQSKPNWRLFIDLTGLLLANHIDILDYVEKTFSPLKISLRTIPALKEMKDNLTHPQPSIFEAHKLIYNLVETGKIHPRPSNPISHNM